VLPLTLWFLIPEVLTLTFNFFQFLSFSSRFPPELAPPPPCGFCSLFPSTPGLFQPWSGLLMSSSPPCSFFCLSPLFSFFPKDPPQFVLPCAAVFLHLFAYSPKEWYQFFFLSLLFLVFIDSLYPPPLFIFALSGDVFLFL